MKNLDRLLTVLPAAPLFEDLQDHELDERLFLSERGIQIPARPETILGLADIFDPSHEEIS